jgi:hypothetical protein
MNTAFLPSYPALLTFPSPLFIFALWFLLAPFVAGLFIRDHTFIFSFFLLINGSAPCATPARGFGPSKDDPGRDSTDLPDRCADPPCYNSNS